MMAWVCAALAVMGQAGGGPQPERAATQARLVTAVEAALDADPELRRHHEGYLAYLDAHPAIAPAETTFSECNALSGFSQVVRDFDEALQRDHAAQTLFDRYYEALAGDAALRTPVETLCRRRLEAGAGATALEFLEAHPEDAVSLLESAPDSDTGPSDVEPFLSALEKRPGLHEEFLRAFRALDESPMARTHVFPWWRAQAEDGAVAKNLRRMQAYFAEHPHHFWVWHTRETALASDPHGRDWIRYWRRRARRHPVLAGRYDAYLGVLRRHPQLRTRADPWPPETAPPRLPSLPAEMRKPLRPLKQDLMPARPDMPTMPKMPEMPVAPTRPETPPKPAMQQRSN